MISINGQYVQFLDIYMKRWPDIDKKYKILELLKTILWREVELNLICQYLFIKSFVNQTSCLRFISIDKTLKSYDIAFDSFKLLYQPQVT